MRSLAAIIFALILGCAVLAADASKPFTMRIDAHSPGPWVRYAAAPTTVPSKPDLVCMYAFIPGQLVGGEKPITET